MERGLTAAVDSRLITFNTLAMQAQDDAYTLAYYLLGDERGAEQATQAAFNQLYQRTRLQAGRFRLEALRQVMERCQRQNHNLRKPSMLGASGHTFAGSSGSNGSSEAIFGKLLDLKDCERGVLVLVDVLGLDYEQAAQVLGSTKKQVGKLLAQARINLSQGEEIRQ